ncbi:TetR/AcrR family transcriptional regulator [Streptomyces asoensis]|uniref:TetR/AcrR family transcriptional regulator n=1 Tax=Streptomyces asoensis TaxID=249586 RepID=UPI0033FEF00B
MTQDAAQGAQKPAEAGPPPRPRRGRGRRPAAEVRTDVLDAAGGLLLDAGMGSFTIEAVAERAGVSKTTLYKWWPSKGALALDGYFHAVESALAFPDTGDLRADLTTQLRAFVRILTRTPAGRVIAELIGQAQTDPELSAALLERYSGPRRDLAVRRMRAAQAEGRLHPDVDPEVVVDQLWGACYHRLLLPNLPVDEDFADSLVANLWRGIGI